MYHSALKQIEEDPKSLIVITGPTCTGKTDLSIKLAEKFSIPIINSDSRLIFDEMNIGTAKPSEEELARVAHHLVNIKKPNENYSAGQYREDFDKVMQEIKFDPELKKPQAIIVGGTGLYLRAALENLDMPEVSRDKELRSELDKKDLDTLLTELGDMDPEAHKDIDTKNKVRVIRAYEIVKKSGKALSQNRSKASENRYDVKYLGINFHNRRSLYDLINKRVINMLKNGLVHEVEGLVEKYGVTETLMGTIGYKEVIGYLKQEYSLSEARRRIQKKTRVYAKRQMTWFKPKQDISWLYREDFETVKL